MKVRGRIDGNQRAIVEALRENGCTVQSLANIGRGCPDLLVGYKGTNYVLEIKNPKQAPSKQRLTDHETKWINRWAGTVIVARTAWEAWNAIRLISSDADVGADSNGASGE